MKYSKQPIDIPEQLSILKQRGLIIEDNKLAIQDFSSISYFRLACYWKTFEQNFETHKFATGTNLSKIISLYTFDRDLRSIIFAAIQDIEIAIRTRIIHYFSIVHGAFWFMDKELFSDEKIFQKCLENLKIEVSRSKEEFLQDHFLKYDEPPMPPVWKTLEVASFGTLSKLYCNMQDVAVKKSVAKSFGLPQYRYMESWMRSISVLRNYCAHHARLWNRRFPMIPQMPEHLPLNLISTKQLKAVKIYPQLSALLYLEQNISPKAKVKEKFLNLFAKQPPERMKAMGFPNDWIFQDLWN